MDAQRCLAQLAYAAAVAVRRSERVCQSGPITRGSRAVLELLQPLLNTQVFLLGVCFP